MHLLKVENRIDIATNSISSLDFSRVESLSKELTYAVMFLSDEGQCLLSIMNCSELFNFFMCLF